MERLWVRWPETSSSDTLCWWTSRRAITLDGFQIGGYTFLLAPLNLRTTQHDAHNDLIEVSSATKRDVRQNNVRSKRKHGHNPKKKHGRKSYALASEELTVWTMCGVENSV